MMIEFLTRQPSAMFSRLTAPKHQGGGRFKIGARLGVHLDPGDPALEELGSLVPCVSAMVDALTLREADQVRDMTVTVPLRESGAIRLREVDHISLELAEDGTELRAEVEIRKVIVDVSEAGATVEAVVLLDVRADQVAELCRLAIATRTRVSDEQLSIPGVGRAVVAELRVVRS